MNIIYTCITGRYDNLQPITVPSGWRAICFTDNEEMEPRGWEILPMPYNVCNVKSQRMMKIFPHICLPEHKTSIWIDGNITLEIPLNEYVKCKEEGFWVMEHPERNCVYDEAAACVKLKKDSQETIATQMAKYIQEGYPVGNGMVGTGIMIRENSKEFWDFSDAWADEVNAHSHRDQLSFNYAATKTNLKFNLFPFLYGAKKTRHN